MLFLNTKNDIDKVKHLPIDVVKAIKINLMILDENYGENRGFYDDGGVVCFIETVDDISKLSQYFNGVESIGYEYFDEIVIDGGKSYSIGVKIISSDYGVVLIGLTEYLVNDREDVTHVQ